MKVLRIHAATDYDIGEDRQIARVSVTLVPDDATTTAKAQQKSVFLKSPSGDGRFYAEEVAAGLRSLADALDGKGVE